MESPEPIARDRVDLISLGLDRQIQAKASDLPGAWQSLYEDIKAALNYAAWLADESVYTVEREPA